MNKLIVVLIITIYGADAVDEDEKIVCDYFSERTDGQIIYSDDRNENGGILPGALATLQCHNGNIRRIRCTSAGWRPQEFIPCELLARDASGVESRTTPVSGCPSLTNVSNGFVVYSPLGLAPFRPDTEATVLCNLGFVPSGNLVTKCQNNGNWTEFGGCISASGQKCQPLAEVPNAQISYVSDLNGPFGVGAIAELTCNIGYMMNGVSRITCNDEGWKPEKFGSCEEGIGSGSCLPLSVINGQINYIQSNPTSLYSSGTTAILTCNSDFTPIGSSSSYCSGTAWTPPLGQCQSTVNGMNPQGVTGLTGFGGSTCLPMIATLNSNIVYSSGSTAGPFPTGTTATLLCNIGYSSQTSTITSLCQNGVWYPSSLGPCTAGIGTTPGIGSLGGFGTALGGMSCMAEPTPINGQIQYSSTNTIGSYPEGSSATLICQSGSMVSGASTTYCRSGQWYPPLGQCIYQNGLTSNLINGFGTTASVCPLGITPPLNGQVTYSTGLGVGPFPQGTVATLTCTQGVSIGPASATCSYGQWLPPTFQGCENTNGGIGTTNGIGGNECISGPIALGGSVQYSQGGNIGPFPSGTTATLLCASGQPLSGQSTAMCSAGVWSPSSLGPCQGLGQTQTGVNGFTGLNGFTNGGFSQCIIGLVAPINGRITYSQGSSVGPFPSGTSATLSCDIGYTPYGQTTSYCQNGVFSPSSLGACLSSQTGSTSSLAGSGISSCYSLPNSVNGIVSYTNLPSLTGTYPIGTTASLQCNMGFYSLGSTTSTCLSNGWSTYSLGSCVSQITTG
uniref:Sushi, von Willebrand factor type A, EGF and pentraxin domain-containing protein 1 n=1 Tax=Bursaphelenchus xylophilus TaxID=6326 RepID=A0A1I7RY11_BURXY